MKQASVFRSALNALLSVSIVVSSPGIVLAGQSVQNSKKIDTHRILTEYKESLYTAYPLLEEVASPKDNAPVPEELKAHWNLDNPLLDENPFFMRDQKWSRDYSLQKNEKAQQTEYLYQSLPGQTKIAFSKWLASLTLPLELEPILNSSEYLFFTAKKGSKIFAEKLNSTKENGEGLFYISKEELQERANLAQQGLVGSAVAVPIYYFALSDKGWMGKVEAFEWEDMGQIVIYNNIDNVPLPIDLNDIIDHHKHARLNLAFAQAISMLIDKGELRNYEMMSPYPARGSTAAFGTFLSGVTLDEPDFSFSKVSNYSLKDKINKFAKLLLPKAYAETSLIDPAVLERLWFVGKLVGGGFLASLGLKYTLYRDYFKNKYQATDVSPEERKKGITGWLQKVSNSAAARETKGILDVYAHTLTTMVKFIPLNIINVLEYIGDRYLTRAMASDNSIMRKTFLATYGWARGSMKNLAVNYKTWFLGSIVMGSVDTIFVVVQLLWVTPWLVAHLAGVDPSMATTVGAATAVFVTSEIIRNITGYFNNGAFSYSHEQKVIVQDKINHEVDQEMRRQGLDPMAKENKRERELRREKRMDQAMKLRGLPGEEEFLYDANSLFKKILNGMGFEADSLGVPEEISQHLVLQEGRWGLVKPAIAKAIKSAKSIQSEFSSRVGADAVKILETLDSRLSYLTAMLKMPWSVVSYRNYLKEAKQVRQVLTLLSFGGDVEKVYEYLPDWFLQMSSSREAVVAAARLYHASFFGILEGDKDAVLVSKSTKERVRTYMGALTPENNTGRLKDLEKEEKTIAQHESEEEAKKAAESKRRENKPRFDSLEANPYSQVIEDVNINKPDSVEAPEQPQAESSLIAKVDKIYDEAGNDLFLRAYADNRALKTVDGALERKKEIETYKPNRGGWFKRWQKSRAHKRAKIEMLEKTASNELTSTNAQDYKNAYTKHLSHIVALYPQFGSKASELIVADAEEASKQQLEQPEEVTFLESLTEEERVKYEVEVFADHFFTAYKSKTVDSDDVVPAESSENPGFFQRIRTFLVDERPVEGEGYWKNIKRKVVNTKGAKAINKVLRGTEALWSTGSYNTGILSMLERNIPLFHDGWRNMWRDVKLLPHLVTFAYLVQYYVWQVKYDYFLWVFFVALGFTGTMAMEFNNRLMQNWGIKPMEGVKSKIKYSAIHSWLTYPSMIPVFMFAQDIKNFSDKIYYGYVTPAVEQAGQMAHQAAAKAAELGPYLSNLCDSILK